VSPARVPPGMKTLISQSCANFLSGRCMAERQCSVLSGSRCPWFEKTLLPTAGAALVEIYARRYAAEKETINRCNDCQAAIAPRLQYCPKCRKTHRRQSWKTEKKKQRSTV